MSNFFKKAGATGLDIIGNILSGAAKSLEGILDMGAGVVGGIGGIFDEDFQRRVKENISVDYADKLFNDVLNLDELTEESYTNEGKVGQFVENVASGVGQMLPAVAVSFIPGVGPVLANSVVGVSAAGNSTEEAFNDGADYWKGMGYGAASGAVELATERLMGGQFDKVLGKSAAEKIAKSLGKEVADTGLKRVAKEAIGEGLEEMGAELANPALKGIYKGLDAFKEYGDKEYWKGVGEAGLVGAGTSLAYGGTVGKIMNTSGKSADISSSLESNKNIDEKLQALEGEGANTTDTEAKAAENQRKNLDNIERALKASTAKQRAELIKRYKLESTFEADGTLKAEVAADLDNRINKADTGIKGEYYSVNARGKEKLIAEDLSAISNKLAEEYAKNNEVSIEEAKTAVGDIKAYSGELSDAGRQNLAKTKKALNALNKLGNSGVSLVVMDNVAKDGNITTNGTIIGDRIYMTAEAIESGKWAKTLVHEYTHFEEGTEEYKRLVSHLLEDKALFESADADVTDANYSPDIETYSSEVAAKMSESLLGNEHFINKLVKQDASLAEKVIDKIKALKGTLSTMTDAEARAEHKRLVKAENLYLKAAKAAGNHALVRKILAERDEKDDGAEFSRQAETQVYTDDVSGAYQKYRDRIDAWDKKTTGFSFVLGDVSGAISDIEIDGKKIGKRQVRIDATKVKTILSEHENMDINVIKKLPDIINNPLVIMDSKSISGRLVLFGEVYDNAGRIVLVALELNPSTKSGNSQYVDIIKIASAYGKRNIQTLLDTSNIRYISKNKNRVNDWLKVNRLQLPLLNSQSDSATNSIPDSSEKSNSFSEKSEKIQMSRSATPEISNKKIAPGMSDTERYEVLRSKYVRLTAKVDYSKIEDTETGGYFDEDTYTKLDYNSKKLLLLTVGEEFGVYNNYNNIDIELDFTFSKGNLKHSVRYQKTNYSSFAKMLSCFDEIIKNAVGIEMHNRNSEGYKKDPTLKNMYVLASAFVDGDNVIPVKLEIKEFTDKNNTLYVAIALDKIKADEVVTQGNTKNGVTKQYARSSAIISISDLFKKINPSDESFYKYIPKPFLNERKIQFSRSTVEGNKDVASKNANDTHVTVTRGLHEKEKAKYQSDKVYSRKDVLEILKTSFMEHIPSAKREEIADELWYSLNKARSDSERYSRIDTMTDTILTVIADEAYAPEVKEDIKSISAKINLLKGKLEHSNTEADKKDFAEQLESLKQDLKLLRESTLYQNASKEEIEAMVDETKELLHILVEHSGKPSLNAKLQEAKKRYKEVKDRYKFIGELIERVNKLNDFKKGRFQNASKYRPEIFKDTINKLTRINFRGNLNESGTRKIMDTFRLWYNTENPLFTTSDSDNYTDNIVLVYDEHIAKCIDDIADGDGTPTNVELKKLSDVVGYLTKLEETYQAVFKNGEYYDAAPENREMRKIAETNNELKSGVIDKWFESWYSRNFLNAKALVDYNDKYDENGFFSTTFREIADGEIKREKVIKNLYSKFDDFFEKNKNYFESNKKRTISFNGVDMDIATARSLYMTLLDADAALALIGSGYSCHDKGKKICDLLGMDTDSLEGLSKAKKKKKAAIIAKEKAAQLYEHFSQTDKEFISIVQKIFNEDGRALKIKYDVEQNGYSRLSQVGGYHYPIVRDNIVYEIGGFSIDDRGRSASFNKHRVDSGLALFILPDTVLLERYINALANYGVISPIIRNFKVRLHLSTTDNYDNPDTLLKLLRNSFANPKIVKKNGESKTTAFERFFTELFEDIQGRSKSRKSELESGLRSATVKSLLALNPKTICNQTASLFSAMSVLNPKYLFKGIKYAGWRTSDVDKYCDLALIRDADNDVFLSQANLDRKNTFVNKTQGIGDFFMNIIGWMDRQIVKLEWGWAQAEIQATKGLKIGTEENKRAAGELLSKTIFLTQQNALATTKSAAMRSDSGLLRQLTTMTSDAVQVASKPITSLGKLCTLKKKLKLYMDNGDADGAARIKAELEKTKPQFARDVGALVSTAVWTALITMLFKWLYHRDDEEATGREKALAFGADVFGNTISAFPIISDLYNFCVTGYGIEDFSMSALNDLFEACSEIFDYAEAVSEGNADSRDTARMIRKVVYAGGHVLGLPMRNAYNVIYMIIGFNDKIKYNVDDLFYKQSYNKDLAKAIENGDEEMVATIIGIMTGERVGDITDKQAQEALNRLTLAGHSVIPKSVPESLTYKEVEYTLDTTAKAKFKTVYQGANEDLAELVKLTAFERVSEEIQAGAVKRLYSIYYDLARTAALGTEPTSVALFAKVLDVETLALAAAYANGIEADIGKDGKALAGSKKEKVQKFVNSLKLTAAEKYMVMGYLGYKNKYGEAQVKAYINRQKLTKSEKEALLKASGY